MASRSFYREAIYFHDPAFCLTDALEDCIQMLLAQNHGVGILGGYYTPHTPICLVSALALALLGYDDAAQLQTSCNGSLLALFAPDASGIMTEEAFRRLPPIFEKHLYTRSGQTCWVRIVKWDGVAPNGQPMWLMSLCDMDTVHQREAQLICARDEADHANQAKTKFFSRMSHDIRTPMNAILGMAHIAQEHLDDPTLVSDALHKIIRESHRLKRLIDEVLDMSRLEQGQVELLHEPFSLRAELEHTTTLFTTLAAERGIDFPPPHLQHRHDGVCGSSMHIRRVLENVLSNAVKYTPAGGRIERWVEESPIDKTHALLHFTVQDTGIGMDAEFQKQMFEPFARAEESETPGAGLGLAITSELVRKMHGTIRVKSAPGAGTRVTVTLPLELTDALPQPDVQDHTPLRLDGVHILLAEDNALNSEILEYMLRQTGAHVETVQTGTQAVAVFAASRPEHFQLILMDVMMPELSGLDAARAIRRAGHPQAATIPIIAVTANAFSTDVRAALDAGMNEHIAKPLDAAQLNAVLRRYFPERTH